VTALTTPDRDDPKTAVLPHILPEAGGEINYLAAYLQNRKRTADEY
jgi:hypothetical protein